MKKLSKNINALENARILVTGGSGFIGSHLLKELAKTGCKKVFNIDKLTYAADETRNSCVNLSMDYEFLEIDIASESLVNKIQELEPNFIFHLAAESHVDRSIDSPDDFINTNICGTLNILKGLSLLNSKNIDCRLVHVSTDEVYGSLVHPDDDPDSNSNFFYETSQYDPRSPYSASKAASDHLVSSWVSTYGVDAIITHCTNNYGPNQDFEKFIPKVIYSCLRNQPIEVYGDGKNIRDWIYVEDHCSGLILASELGVSGEVYNFGGDKELENINLVNTIIEMVSELGLSHLGKDNVKVKYITDRPGHDRRYAIDSSKAKSQLGWKQSESFNNRLKETIKWYSNKIEGIQ